MRIQGSGVGAVEERERPKAESSAVPTATAAGSGPAVVVSEGARQIAAAQSRADLVRSQRVATVRAQVESGDYKIDKDKLADRLADDELARAGRRE